MKILMILPRVPYPLEKGDKLRAFHQLRLLSRHHEIFLFCINDDDLHADALDKLTPYCKGIMIHDLSWLCRLWNLFRVVFTGLPFQVGYFYSSQARKKVKNTVRTFQPDHIYCQLVRTAEYARDFPVKKTLDYQDVFSKGIERRLISSPWYLKWILRSEYNRMLRYENTVFEWFNNKTIISEPDRQWIPHPEKNTIEVIPNGVNFEYYQPQSLAPVYDLLFTGNMSYPPNIDSVEFLVNDILPLVYKERPETTLLIAGASPHHKVKSLATDKITVGGWVRDIRDCYSQARLFIAPMRIGTGLQNKLLEAMSMGLPCITSPLANNALKAQENKEILVGMKAQDFASHVLFLLNNPEKARMMGNEGSLFVRGNFNWETYTSKLENIIIQTK
jgi:sugar transferase (PEP-CTERM/EpsH1 system associated)